MMRTRGQRLAIFLIFLPSLPTLESSAQKTEGTEIPGKLSPSDVHLHGLRTLPPAPLPGTI